MVWSPRPEESQRRQQVRPAADRRAHPDGPGRRAAAQRLRAESRSAEPELAQQRPARGAAVGGCAGSAGQSLCATVSLGRCGRRAFRPEQNGQPTPRGQTLTNRQKIVYAVVRFHVFMTFL